MTVNLLWDLVGSRLLVNLKHQINSPFKKRHHFQHMKELPLHEHVMEYLILVVYFSSLVWPFLLQVQLIIFEPILTPHQELFVHYLLLVVILLNPQKFYFDFSIIHFYIIYFRSTPRHFYFFLLTIRVHFLRYCYCCHYFRFTFLIQLILFINFLIK